MKQFQLSLRAKADLSEIWSYIAADNPDAARKFITLLLEKVNLLAQSPKIGSPREDLAKSLRCFPVGRYNIYYAP